MMSIILFNFIAVLLIAGIIWWFWLVKEKAIKVQEKGITIAVKDGVYEPSQIETDQSSITLKFLRTDPSPCSEFVLFDDLDVREQLPLNKEHKIVLKNLKPGSYKFTCQMRMYQGELVVHI